MYLDLRDLADETRNYPEDADLPQLADLCGQLGYTPADETDPENVADTLDEAARNEPTLIPEDEFEDYARDLAADIGAIDSDAGWPLSYIDWSAAADALQSDYTPITYQGTTYWTLYT